MVMILTGTKAKVFNQHLIFHSTTPSSVFGYYLHLLLFYATSHKSCYFFITKLYKNILNSILPYILYNCQNAFPARTYSIQQKRDYSITFDEEYELK